MSLEILVNVSAQETRVALVDGGTLQEVFIERESRHGLVGNLYKGRVQRVLPGMQAAFVEIGLERTAFLHARDIEMLDHGSSARRRQADRGADDAPPATEVPPVPDIRELLREGQEVLVQVVKDPMGTKGARLTTQISLPSRYLVLLPHTRSVGISAKIEDDAERSRLRQMLAELMDETQANCGFIARTAGESADREALKMDMLFLSRLWDVINLTASDAPTGTMVYGDLPMEMRILRDLLGTDVDRVRIDDEDSVRSVKKFTAQFLPEATDRIEFHASKSPLFDLYGIEDELNRALGRRVDLKSGGYLIIDQTEAMTTVDVNTGAYVGHRNLEETIFKTNQEAAQAVARQLRLRNLGGIVIIDFIDMQDEAHRQQVVAGLEKAMAGDPARSMISGISPLGLVEMTRKRTRESLEHIMCAECPTCDGRGSVKSVETVCLEIFREVMRSARQFQADNMMIMANHKVTASLLDEHSATLAELEDTIGMPIRLQAEALYAPEAYDVVLL